MTLAAVYCPPRLSITEDQFLEFFNTLGEKFIAAGDYNTKHIHWGSRLVSPKGKHLYNAVIKKQNKLDYVSPGRPTYWPADTNKIPDLIDFAVTKKTCRNMVTAQTLADLSSDHSPVLIELFNHPHILNRPQRLLSNSTNWSKYKKYVCSHIEPSPELNTEEDVENLTETLEAVLVSAAKAATPAEKHPRSYKITNQEIELL